MKYIFFLISILYLAVGNAQCFQDVSAGYRHTLAITTDGNLWAWGSNSDGAIGMGVIIPDIFYLPVMVNGDGDWDKVFASSGKASFAIRNDGTLWAWGDGIAGGLGFGNQDNVYVPTLVGNDTDWVYVTSWAHTIAMKSDGTLWGWGNNSSGQLNLNTTGTQFERVQISEETNWAQVVAGGAHTIAIKDNGTLWACGLNNKGQVGNGTNTNQLEFVQIGTDTDWVQVAAHYEHSLGIKSDGTIWGWGSNTNSVIGQPDIISERASPTQIGVETDWAFVDTGYFVTFALKTNGTLWRTDPVIEGFMQIESDFDWNYVDSGSAFAMLMKMDNTLWGQGGNDYGQLGLGVQIQGTLIPLQLECEAFGIDEQENTMISVFPNPVDGMLHISNETALPIDKLVLSDLTGKVLFVANNNLSEIDLSNYESGIYLLSVNAGDHVGVYKVIKK